MLLIGYCVVWLKTCKIVWSLCGWKCSKLNCWSSFQIANVDPKVFQCNHWLPLPFLPFLKRIFNSLAVSPFTIVNKPWNRTCRLQSLDDFAHSFVHWWNHGLSNHLLQMDNCGGGRIFTKKWFWPEHQIGFCLNGLQCHRMTSTCLGPWKYKQWLWDASIFLPGTAPWVQRRKPVEKSQKTRVSKPHL